MGYMVNLLKKTIKFKKNSKLQKSPFRYDTKLNTVIKRNITPDTASEM